jgi:hypothetical protein
MNQKNALNFEKFIITETGLKYPESRSFVRLPDCPAREIEWPCPDSVQLSPEKIEQEKKQAEKKIFRSVHSKRILGSLEKIEIVYGYTVYVFSDGSR